MGTTRFWTEEETRRGASQDDSKRGRKGGPEGDLTGLFRTVDAHRVVVVPILVRGKFDGHLVG